MKGSSGKSGSTFRPVRNGIFLNMKADFGLGLRNGRSHELADGFEKRLNSRIVTFDFLFQLVKFAGEFLMKRKSFSETHKSAHYGHIDLNGLLAAKDAR